MTSTKAPITHSFDFTIGGRITIKRISQERAMDLAADLVMTLELDRQLEGAERVTQFGLGSLIIGPTPIRNEIDLVRTEYESTGTHFSITDEGVIFWQLGLDGETEITANTPIDYLLPDEALKLVDHNLVNLKALQHAQHLIDQTYPPLATIVIDAMHDTLLALAERKAAWSEVAWFIMNTIVMLTSDTSVGNPTLATWYDEASKAGLLTLTQRQNILLSFVKRAYDKQYVQIAEQERETTQEK